MKLIFQDCIYKYALLSNFEVQVVDFQKQQINSKYILYCGTAPSWSAIWWNCSKAMNRLIPGKWLFYMTRNDCIRAQLKGKNLNEMAKDQTQKWYACTWHMKNARIMKTVTKYHLHESTGFRQMR
jgi:hypothetical protein